MIYKYKAVKLDGEIIEGFFESKTKREVILMLKNESYMPIFIEEDIAKGSEVEIFKSKVSKKDIAIFCRQFFTIVSSGISIVRCLEILSIQTENKTLKEALKLVYVDLQRGITLSDAMGRHEKILSPILINMITVGEISGNLDDILERMSIHFEKEYKLENKIKSALLYPIILIIVSLAVVVFMLVAVLPTFIEMFESSGAELPALTILLLNISKGLQRNWNIILIGITIILIMYIYYKNSHKGKRKIDFLKIRLPLIKKINQKIITSRFTRTLSILISSGIPLIESLKIVGNVVNNSIIKSKLEDGVDHIKIGTSLSETIENMGIFSPMVYSMIKIGEESGSLDNVLVNTAEFYDEEVEIALQKMTTLIEPVLLVVMAIVIGFIVIAIALPMFDLANII